MCQRLLDSWFALKCQREHIFTKLQTMHVFSPNSSKRRNKGQKRERVDMWQRKKCVKMEIVSPKQSPACL